MYNTKKGNQRQGFNERSNRQKVELSCAICRVEAEADPTKIDRRYSIKAWR